ncbi:flagellar motor protein MotB [Hydrogenivirga sp. 128-5-R1-1]|uniref:OmpA/MotB family protein n=1 Tax=Hydrogenivirga sp. 128-5-R1-1 TaxID=392423 RepID=UPI00015F3652|nr:flagellar motor protein MotB [Hydrogenivirga sp. 128-5-R1-1]EDP76352.1 predicted inner membrane protein [Hydrogenivirga sp. 128-5-R1-1]
MAFKKKEECPKPPAWLTSFSDLMSLLLTFFILIYAMSSLDVAQLEKFISYFQPERKMFVRKTSILPPIAPPPKEVALKIKRRVQKVLPPWAFQIVITADFVKLRLFDKVFFEDGTYQLTPKAREALVEVANVLKKLPENSFIRVEGHVSSLVEVRGRVVRDKWELSVRRATEVVRFLQAQGVEPTKLSAAGYGDIKPLYTWRQPILMERNNRVEIYINLVKPKE